MKKSPIRKVSDKQRIRNAQWARVKRERIKYLTEIYGFTICEWSGEYGILDDIESLNFLDAHHIDNNRRNTTPENCYIVKRKYHSYITDNNNKVKQEDFQGRKNENTL